MNRRDKPDEPVLEVEHIQGIVVPGFIKPHQVLVQVQFTDDRETLAEICRQLALWHAERPFSSARATLVDRKKFRRARFDVHHQLREPPAAAGQAPAGLALSAIAFTYQGLAKLTPQAFSIPSLAFVLGMPARSSLLGDPVAHDEPGAARNWVVGAERDELDALIVFADNTGERVKGPAEELAERLKKAGATCTLQTGAIRHDLPGHEHFGFSDGISQPAIRGRKSDRAEDYVSQRFLPDTDPESVLFGYPGQELVWPGEFVLGYPASSPDPLIPGPVRDHRPWMRNGSFLVYRRLRQDVGAFWSSMKDEAEALCKKTGFADMTPDRLAAKMVGRWPSGAPLSRSPHKDNPALGANPLANNDFRFDDRTPARHGLPPKALDFAPAEGDIIGPVCPVAAHIRKVNVRDQASDIGGTIATQSRRILRVGVPYGRPVPARKKFEVPPYEGVVADEDDRGLLFLSIQASIEDQFEFLQARWMNNPSRPRGPGGHDMVAGQNAATADGVRRCHLFGSNYEGEQVKASRPFVIPTGGGYFFVPSLPLLKELLHDARIA